MTSPESRDINCHSMKDGSIAKLVVIKTPVTFTIQLRNKQQRLHSVLVKSLLYLCAVIPCTKQYLPQFAQIGFACTVQTSIKKKIIT